MERLITRILRRSLVEQRRGFITSSRQLGTAGKTASLGKQQSNSRLRDGLSLEHFLANSQTKPVARAAKRNRESAQNVPYLSEEDISGNGRKGKVVHSIGPTTRKPYVIFYTKFDQTKFETKNIYKQPFFLQKNNFFVIKSLVQSNEPCHEKPVFCICEKQIHESAALLCRLNSVVIFCCLHSKMSRVV